MSYHHVSVMKKEVISCLNCQPGKIYVDGTIGGSGHALSICEKIIPDGLLIGIDQDKDAIQNAKKILKQYESNLRLFHDNFINLPQILSKLNIDCVDGILLDLGVSLNQLKYSGRGFSFSQDEILDMRMNLDLNITAKDLVNNLKEAELVKIYYEYGEERFARRIADKIVRARKRESINTSRQLARIVSSAMGSKAKRKKIHPATKVFMALRIAVNQELRQIEVFMENAADLLKPKGRLCVISFHSLEDRIIKQKIKYLENDCACPPDFPQCVCNKKKIVRSLIKKAKRPSQVEIAINPRSRSAKLRVMKKL